MSEGLSSNVTEVVCCTHYVPTICKPLVSQHIASCVQNHPQLFVLDLADTYDVEASLPVLTIIGNKWEAKYVMDTVDP